MERLGEEKLGGVLGMGVMTAVKGRPGGLYRQEMRDGLGRTLRGTYI